MFKMSKFGGSVAMGLLLSASVAQAANVIIEDGNVTRIEDLVVIDDTGEDIGVYDVDFVFDTGNNVYGAPNFDFPFVDEEQAFLALEAVTDALNENNPIPAGAGPQGTSQFLIGVEDESDPSSGLSAIVSWGGEFFESPGAWDQCETDCLAGTSTNLAGETLTYADFAVASPSAPSYAGVWWEPERAGQGIQLGQDGNTLFGAWYVFDETGGDMWVTFIGTLSGNTMEVDLYRFTGPPLGETWNDDLLEGSVAGNARFTFTSETSATFVYTLEGVDGSLDLEPFAPGATDTYTGIWWEPAKSGQGVYFGQDGTSMFGAWYVFDETGADMWTTFAGTLNGSTLVADLVRFTGPPLGAPWNPSQVNGTTAGTATVTFTSETSATFDYILNGETGSLDLELFDL